MDYYKETIKNVPRMIEVPKELWHRDVDVIFLTLDEQNGNRNKVELDANGYPIGFFERTAGALADDPIERAPQGEYESREDIK